MAKVCQGERGEGGSLHGQRLGFGVEGAGGRGSREKEEEGGTTGKWEEQRQKRNLDARWGTWGGRSGLRSKRKRIEGRREMRGEVWWRKREGKICRMKKEDERNRDEMKAGCQDRFSSAFRSRVKPGNCLQLRSIYTKIVISKWYHGELNCLLMLRLWIYFS